MAWLGYVAMAVVALSFLLKDFRTFRMVNSLGAGLFLVYAVLGKDLPVAGINAFIVLVNMYQLGWLPMKPKTDPSHSTLED